MGVEYEGDKLEDIYRLVKENNRMLRAMRRNAFLGGLVRLIVWVALIIIPFWLYMQYLAPLMQSMLQTMDQIQGTKTSVETQFSGINDALSKLRAQFPQYFQNSGQQ